jgi:hypothetical protein
LRSDDGPADITHANRSARAKGTGAVGDDVVLNGRINLILRL